MADTQWFREARFGMFLHWGLYAAHARGEWYASMERVPPEEYDRAFGAFDAAVT